MGFQPTCTNHSPDVSNVTVDPDVAYTTCVECGAMLDIKGPFRVHRGSDTENTWAVIDTRNDEPLNEGWAWPYDKPPGEIVALCITASAAYNIAAALNLLEK